MQSWVRVMRYTASVASVTVLAAAAAFIGHEVAAPAIPPPPMEHVVIIQPASKTQPEIRRTYDGPADQVDNDVQDELRHHIIETPTPGPAG